jgi:hypothetical protein
VRSCSFISCSTTREEQPYTKGKGSVLLTIVYGVLVIGVVCLAALGGLTLV